MRQAVHEAVFWATVFITVAREVRLDLEAETIHRARCEHAGAGVRGRQESPRARLLRETGWDGIDWDGMGWDGGEARNKKQTTDMMKTIGANVDVWRWDGQ